MTRIALIEIGNGGFQNGFDISLKILSTSDFSETPRLNSSSKGNLPPNTDIADRLVLWQKKSHPNHSQRSKNDELEIEEGIPTNLSVNEGFYAYQEIREIERCIKNWLNDVKLGEIKLELASELKLYQKSDPLQIVIKSEDALICQLYWYAWDLLANPNYLDVGISFIKSRADAFQVTLKKKNRIRILAIFGDSRDINLKKDLEEINKLKEEGAEIVPLKEPSAQELIRTIIDKKGWDILFFAGHSDHENDRGIIYINERESLTIDEFQNALKEARESGLQIAIFNSCKGLGLATELSALQIPFIIFMQHVVPDKIAQFFLKEFLTEYAGGQPLPTAVRLAKTRLEQFNHELPGATWLPVLFQSYTGIAPTWKDFFSTEKEDNSPSSKDRSYHQKKPKLHLVLLISLVITSLVMWERWQGNLQGLEITAFDFLMRQRILIEEPKPDRRISVVSLSPADLQQIRQAYGKTKKDVHSLSNGPLENLIIKIKAAKPQVMGLDIYSIEYVDKKFYTNLQSILGSTQVILPCAMPSGLEGGIAAPNQFPKENIGFINLLDTDKDSVIRRYLLIQNPEKDTNLCWGNSPGNPVGKSIDAFSFKLAMSYLNQHGHKRLDFNKKDLLQIDDFIVYPLPPYFAAYNSSDYVNKGIQVILNYSPYKNYKEDIAHVYSLNDILKDKFNHDQVRDSIVLIGTDRGNDRFKTPYEQNLKLPGVFVHAEMVRYLLDVVEGKRKMIQAWPWFIDIIWVWMWSLVGGIIMWIVPLRKEQEDKYLVQLGLISSTALLTLYVLSFGFLVRLGTWIPLIPSVMAMLMTGLTVKIQNFLFNKNGSPGGGPPFSAPQSCKTNSELSNPGSSEEATDKYHKLRQRNCSPAKSYKLP